MRHTETAPPPKDELERIIRRTVEGQIKCFLTAHPEVSEAWTGKTTHKTKQQAVIDSLSKRISRDLTSPDKRRQMKRALDGGPETTPPDPAISSGAGADD